MSTAPLDGQVALVTGGTRGIGLAISGRLLRCDVRVAARYDSKRETAERFAAQHAGASVHQGNMGATRTASAGSPSTCSRPAAPTPRW
jgi:NAD(P)-dependent dehydrogenase (short-subunit alcohol dehydrogenase family)